MAASPVTVRATKNVTSPGPLHMSDLEMSPPAASAPLPRRLEPLEPPKKRKKKRSKKREPLSLPEPTSESLLGETLRSQLRSRLDPIYNPPPAPLPQLIDSVEGMTTPTHNSDREERSRPVSVGREERNLSEEDQHMPFEPPPVNTPGPTSGEESAVGRQLPALPSDTEDPPQPSMADQLTSGPTRNRPTNIQMFLSSEDLVDEEAGDHMTHTVTLPQPHAHTTHRDGVVYVERKDGRGFVAQKRGQTDTVRGNEGAWSSWADRDITSSQVTLFVHGIMQRLSTTAHGLLAGLCLWDCVVAHVLAGGGDRHIGLLTIYSSLSLPVHTVYLFLLLLVTVSLCDRLDLAGIDKNCLRNFYRPPTQLLVLIALVLVGVAFVLTVSVAAIDERIMLFPQLPSLWLDILDPVNASSSPLPAPTTHTIEGLVYAPVSIPVSSLVTSWLGVVTVRAVLCCTSWLLAVWITGTDRLEGYLRGVSEDGGDTV